MAELSAGLALPGAHLQLRGHQPAAAGGEQALPDNGADLEEDHEECLREPGGELTRGSREGGWGTEEVPGLNSPRARKTGGQVQGFGLGRCPPEGAPQS